MGLDKDNDGRVSREDFQNGGRAAHGLWAIVAAFDHLDHLDINAKDDLGEVFDLIDETRCGEVHLEELVEFLHGHFPEHLPDVVAAVEAMIPECKLNVGYEDFKLRIDNEGCPSESSDTGLTDIM